MMSVISVFACIFSLLSMGIFALFPEHRELGLIISAIGAYLWLVYCMCTGQRVLALVNVAQLAITLAGLIYMLA